MSDIDVVIVGAGPVGLMLACELALHGARRTIVLDTLPGPKDEPRANGVGGPAVRLLDHRGLYEPLTGSSTGPAPLPFSSFAAMPLDVPSPASAQTYMMLVSQPVLNRALAERAAELGIDVRWGHRLVGLNAGADNVRIDVDSPSGLLTLDTSYLVGADGGRGLTRKLAGINYGGMSSRDAVFRLGRGLMPEPGWAGQASVPGLDLQRSSFLRTETGMFLIFTNPGIPELSMVGTLELAPVADDTYVPGQEHPGFGDSLTMSELRESLRRVLRVDMPLRPAGTEDQVDLRRYAGINTLIAEHYRRDRVLLVGDAAHVQSAMGGPGLNLGLQDAANLGFKLAAVVRGDTPPELLDSYETERRIAADCAIVANRAQFALLRPGPEVTSLRQVISGLAAAPEAAQRLSEYASLGHVVYPTEPGDHPAVGQWVPNLTLTTDSGASRIAQLTHDGRPLFLDFTKDGALADAAGEAGDAINVVRAIPTEPTVLTGVLVRPDGYVAWASSESAPDLGGLDGALRRWFGIGLKSMQIHH